MLTAEARGTSQEMVRVIRDSLFQIRVYSGLHRCELPVRPNVECERSVRRKSFIRRGIRQQRDIRCQHREEEKGMKWDML